MQSRSDGKSCYKREKWKKKKKIKMIQLTYKEIKVIGLSHLWYLTRTIKKGNHKYKTHKIMMKL
jgi:hypothetical protein